MNIIRNSTDREELDYNFLLDCLKDYASPRAKITRLLKRKDLIRVKKGIYLFGVQHRRSLYSPEILANMIYGPSYVSLEYALSYHGLIPEGVEEITSVTTKRSIEFSTPVGRYTYRHIPEALFSVGFTCLPMIEQRSALVATPEKALCDLLYLRKFQVENEADLRDLLFENLRLDETALSRFRIGLLKQIRKAGGSHAIEHLITYLRSLR